MGNSVNRFMFRALRGAAILFYLVAALFGLLMLWALVMAALDIAGGAMVDAASILLALAFTLVPAALGFVFERLAVIGTEAGD